MAIRMKSGWFMTPCKPFSIVFMHMCLQNKKFYFETNILYGSFSGCKKNILVFSYKKKQMNKPLEVGLDGKYALCLENSHKLSQEVIKEMFSKYGEVHSIRYVGQSLVFIRYYNFDDASACLNDLSSTYSINPAHSKKNSNTQERLPGGDNFRRRSPGEDRFVRSPVGDHLSRSSNKDYNAAKSSARPQTTTSSTQTQHVCCCYQCGTTFMKDSEGMTFSYDDDFDERPPGIRPARFNHSYDF